MSEILSESQISEKKYSKLLNNLLIIKNNDQSLFTKVNNVSAFDITTKFGKDISQRILTQKEFKVVVNEIDLEELLELLKKSNSYEEIIQAYELKKEKIANVKKVLLENPQTFLQTKNELIENITSKIQKSKSRWIAYRRKVIDENIQENVWPLHVTTFFITFNKNSKVIYAPFLLKEVSIRIDENNIKLVSETPWKINEKLVFILNEEGFKIDENLYFEDDLNAFEATKKLANFLSLNLKNVSFEEKFTQLKKDEITNSMIEIKPGVILGMFKPSGGHLRKTMIEIIKNNEVDEILNPETNKNLYEDKVNDFVINDSHKLLRIQKSNFSQDKALISSLTQDTVIWGPPGTGKSQVIANIIANILYDEKSAVVMSQKKAALDVLKKRLGQISPFVLFILNDNKMNKAEFYKPLQNFVENIEYNRSYLKRQQQSIITKNEIEAINTITKSKLEGSYEPSIKLLKLFDLDKRKISDLFDLNNEYKYPVLTNEIEYKTYENILAKDNGIVKKRRIIFKRYPKYFLNDALNSFNILSQNLNVDYNKILPLTNKTSFSEVLEISKLPENLTRINQYYNDETYIAKHVANRLLNKIEHWKLNNREKYWSYKRFANAVRAGRRLPFKFMNDHVSIIKDLFPLIITTPETSFVNWEKNFFDYVVLDESSQMFIEIGLPILYLAKTKVLAGDTQQMQPTHWFTSRYYGEDGEDEDVAENAESVLNYALDKGTYKIMLNQNFRSSSASLMSFSAKHFYNSDLEVVDKNPKKLISKNETKIIVKNVNGKWESSVNLLEVKTVIDTINEEKENYKTIIVLTFNVLQRQLLEKEIIEKYPDLLKRIENETLTIRNIENVQGDEADLVIMSVVYDETTVIGSTYVARPGGKNALNVAISRAKEKTIVIKSVNSQKIKSANSDDFLIFKKWLEFLDFDEKERKTYSTKNKNKNLEESYGEVESSFEQDVLFALKKNVLTYKKMKILKQYEVGSKRIDLAILDKNNNFKLGIEVDGYEYHEGQGIEQYLADISRQEFLEYKGYPIYRVKEIEWKLNKEKVLKEIDNLIND